ncbi:MAG: metallophosphoesterase [Burkholderiales bacterium]|nr:metallophosphoesterase [Burkholderiales bacterium]
MRTIVHLSDLHFGRVDPVVLEPLRSRVHALEPHLVVVSGDLTQRAKPEQFREAKAFLDSLPQPQLVVPGNHDVPLFNVFQRVFSPLGKYKRIVNRDLEPEFVDDEIAVVGVNTARSFVWKDGSINSKQVERVRRRICDLDERIVKMVVTHHPFDVPEDHDDDEIVDKAARAMQVFAKCGADVLLSGHLHKTNTTQSVERYKTAGHSAIIVQAGTATSTRARGEKNSFNTLRVTADDIAIERWQFNSHSKMFELGPVERYLHAEDGWHRPK